MFFSIIFLPRGSFVVPSQGWGGGRGTILGPFSYSFYKKHENHLKHIFVRFVLPRGSLFVPSRGWGGGRGTILGPSKTLFSFFCLVAVFIT